VAFEWSMVHRIQFGLASSRSSPFWFHLKSFSLVFIARQHATHAVQSAILFYQFCPSVCLSVCPVSVLCQRRQTYRQTLGHISSFSSPTAVTKFQKEPRQWGVKIRGWKIFLYRKRCEIGLYIILLRVIM